MSRDNLPRRRNRGKETSSARTLDPNCEDVPIEAARLQLWRTNMTASPLPPYLTGYSLLDALRERRSRRFGLGMKMEQGPLAYQSEHAPIPLDEEEEALLAFAACGITG